VVVADVDIVTAEQLAEELRRRGATVRAIRTDVAEETQVRALVSQVVAEFGGLDVMCNNAALLDREHLARDTGAVDIPFEVWDRTMRVNLRGVLLGCRHAIPALQARGGGAIVNIVDVVLLWGSRDCSPTVRQRARSAP
jgi:NAD(P)-dependent dehydrogenase (short-subunit alcohol dehydrogenase family)